VNVLVLRSLLKPNSSGSIFIQIDDLLSCKRRGMGFDQVSGDRVKILS
jgi:hypothetical protein